MNSYLNHTKNKQVVRAEYFLMPRKCSFVIVTKHFFLTARTFFSAQGFFSCCKKKSSYKKKYSSENNFVAILRKYFHGIRINIYGRCFRKAFSCGRLFESDVEIKNLMTLRINYYAYKNDCYRGGLNE